MLRLSSFVIAGLLALSGQYVAVPFTKASGGGGTPAIVHATTCDHANSGSATFSCTIPSTTSGNALLLACAMNDGTTISSTSPTSAALMTPGDGGGATTVNLSLNGVANISGSLTSVSITTSNSSVTADCQIDEVSGLPTTLTADQTTNVLQSSYSSGSATNFTGSVTTTHAHDMVLGLAAGYIPTFTGSPVFTAGTGYTAIGQTTGTYFAVFIEYQNVTATGSYNPGATFTNGPTYVATATTAVEF